MSSSTFQGEIVSATKWSALTELMAKLVAPISNMILARLLMPEVFGIVAAINTVISFCDIFADAGFQKYIIQNQEQDPQRQDELQTVAFWTNLALSLLVWAAISLLATPIAGAVGCLGHEQAIIVACASLPLHAISSIQTARLRRKLNFKTLFYTRIIVVLVPFFVTIPLAIATRSYWALIVGTLVSNAGVAFSLMLLNHWRPALKCNLKTLSTMLNFSMWSMFESFLVWMINWGDTFIVSAILTTHLFGVYRTAITMVNQIVGIVSATMVPVLLSALSRQRKHPEEFAKTFYQIAYLSGMLLIPMGIGMYIFRKTMCSILLGPEWIDGADLMGIWGLISALAVIFNSYFGTVLIAMGRPKISVWIQVLQICVIMPVVYFSAKLGFHELSYARALVRCVGMVAFCVVVWRLYSISAIKLILQYTPIVVASAVMSLVGRWCIFLNRGVGFEMLSILLCVVVYLTVMMCFKQPRAMMLQIVKKITHR